MWKKILRYAGDRRRIMSYLIYPYKLDAPSAPAHGKKRLSIVTMVRNEETYIADWMLFHLFCGVEHFFIYVNDAELAIDRYQNALRKSGIDLTNVTFITFPNIKFSRIGSRYNTVRILPSTQELAFIHFERNYKKSCEYYIKLDIDEFMFPRDFKKNGCDLKRFLDFRGNLLVRGFNFGSGGELSRTDISVPCRFKKHAKILGHEKSIAESSSTREVFNAHVTGVVSELADTAGTAEHVCLNHYYMLSFEEFCSRRLVTTGYMAGDFVKDDFLILDSQLNEVHNEDACTIMTHAREWARERDGLRR